MSQKLNPSVTIFIYIENNAVDVEIDIDKAISKFTDNMKSEK